MKSLLILSQLFLLVSTGSLIWLVVRAFRRHIGWGLAVMFLSPFSAIFFAVRHWNEAGKPFLLYIGSFFAGFALMLYVFVSWGGVQTLMAAKRVAQGIHDKTLTDGDARRFMESNVNFIEKAADSEKDGAVAGVMRKFIRLSDSGFTESEQRELSGDIFDVLQRSDLSDEDREKLEDLRRQMEGSGTDPGGSGGSIMENIKGLIGSKPAAIPVDEKAAGDSKPEPAPSRFISVPVERAGEHVGASAILTTRNGHSQQCALVKVSGDTLYFEKHISGGSIAFEVPASEIRSLKILVEY
jgi:hypothetical protein